MKTQAVLLLACVSIALGVPNPDPDVVPEPKGEHFKKTLLGKDYKGNLAVTKEGKTCQRWDSSTPHSRTSSAKDPAKFPDATLKDAANYCRNPDGDAGGPWCYTTDPEIKYQYCDVKMKIAAEDCKLKHLQNYMGNLAVTKEGKTCARWDSQTAHYPNDASINPANFPDKTLADAANYCRNPSCDAGGPWCYTTDPKIKWQHCNLKLKIGERLKETQLGRDYMGDLAMTKEGKKCQRWDSLTPHDPENDDKHPANFPDATIADAANYCRNPGGSKDGPWCYTTDPGTKYQLCDVKLRLEADCKYLQHYIGNLAVTKTGRKCQRWDSQVPHVPSDDSKNPAKFQDKTIADAANYCRNPNCDAGGPWCYTTDPEVKWEHCDMKLKIGVRSYKDYLGKDYMGDLAMTKGGKKCQRWDSLTPHNPTESAKNPAKFPDVSIADAANYCRNPDGDKGGPWCYTTDPGTKYQNCDLKWKKEHFKKTHLGRDYKGDLAETKEGKECQRWDSSTPHNPTESAKYPDKFPDATIKDAANYCRNPDDDIGGPWCYTTDPKTRFQHCDVKLKIPGIKYKNNGNHICPSFTLAAVKLKFYTKYLVGCEAMEKEKWVNVKSYEDCMKLTCEKGGDTFYSDGGSCAIVRCNSYSLLEKAKNEEGRGHYNIYTSMVSP